jgi:hypothetical protein
MKLDEKQTTALSEASSGDLGVSSQESSILWFLGNPATDSAWFASLELSYSSSCSSTFDYYLFLVSA